MKYLLPFGIVAIIIIILLFFLYFQNKRLNHINDSVNTNIIDIQSLHGILTSISNPESHNVQLGSDSSSDHENEPYEDVSSDELVVMNTNIMLNTEIVNDNNEINISDMHLSPNLFTDNLDSIPESNESNELNIIETTESESVIPVKKTKKIPESKAKEYDIGYQDIGRDGNNYVVYETSNGQKRWKKLQ